MPSFLSYAHYSHTMSIKQIDTRTKRLILFYYSAHYFERIIGQNNKRNSDNLPSKNSPSKNFLVKEFSFKEFSSRTIFVRRIVVIIFFFMHCFNSYIVYSVIFKIWRSILKNRDLHEDTVLLSEYGHWMGTHVLHIYRSKI